MLDKLSHNIAIAAESMLHNRLRALLTSLGIIFGVGSVISMLAIGNGAQQEILEQIKLLGANNVIITPVVEQTEGAVSDEMAAQSQAGEEANPFSPGLTVRDAESILSIVPGIAAVSPEMVIETMAIRSGMRRSTKLVGVEQAYFEDSDFQLESGSFFTRHQIENAETVCIIGQHVKTRFFAKEEPLGKRIKCGNLWLTVVGVLEQRDVDAQQLDHLGLRDFNLDIYTPLRTIFLREENRAKITAQDIQDAGRNRNAADNNYHQLDRLVVRVSSSDIVKPVADVITRMLQRRHNGVVDYQVLIPEVLLQQERRTQSIFNIVLAAIASISLVVGGIGIMNIMLASVMERTKEIGIRRSLGATRRDIILQFLIEAMTISFTGGIIGILLGVVISVVIEQMTGIVTIVSAVSILLSFFVSVSVGLIFGLLPAKKASDNHPVTALHYE